MKLIIGLGNPGPQYEGTRHNAGFWFVDLLARRHGGEFKSETRFYGQICRIRADGHECWLLKPGTFMNRSGQSVSSLARYFRIAPDEILVAHDELDLPAGTVRLKKGGGHAGHNGLRDIVSALGSREFWRLRIGIDRPANGRQVVDYVLGRPSRADDDAIDDAIEQAADALPEILDGAFQRAMNRLHVRGEKSE
jgi:PTH1 family peptidyl-tRNA hydrolase